MYDRLLVAVDHSEVTSRLLGAAQELALLSGGEVWLLHLREHEFAGKAPGGQGLPSVETSDAARADLDKAVRQLAEAGVKAHGEMRNTLFGHAAREIVNDAKARDVDTIIMGSRGRGDMAGLLVGSTAHKVMHLSDRPVLVVR